MMKNIKHLNEMTPELLWRSAAAQRRRLKDTDYLKNITAFDYIKLLKRVEDFEEYADEIITKINNGKINAEIPNSENDTLKKIERENPNVQVQSEIDSEEDNNEEQEQDLEPVDVKTRKLEMKKAPIEKKFIKYPNPIINRTSDFNTILKAIYIVVYISNIDDDIASVWFNANSKEDAANKTIHEFWDVKEIVDVYIKGEGKIHIQHNKNNEEQTEIINPDNFDSSKDLANACADIVTGGEFKNMTELVADIKDDQTTVDSSDTDFYEGTDIDNIPWGGKKSSVRLVCESENFDWQSNSKNKNGDEFEVEIITSINPNGNDGRIKANLSAKMMRKALSKGIVHIVFIKADGSERQAYATTNEEVLEINKALPSGSGRNNLTNENQVRFYDMTIKKWRSFLMERLTIVYDESY